MKIQKHVHVDGRHFIVTFDLRGNPMIVKERLVHAKGEPQERVCDKPRWHHADRDIPKRPGALYARVINEARNQL